MGLAFDISETQDEALVSFGSSHPFSALLFFNNVVDLSVGLKY